MDEKRLYRRIRVVTAFMTLAITQLMLVNEDVSFKVLILPCPVIVYAAMMFTGPLSKKILHHGDELEKNKRTKFYLASFFGNVLLIFVVFLLCLRAIITISDSMSGWDGLGFFVITFIILIITCVVLAIPLLQAFIVMLVRRVGKRNIPGFQ